MTYWTNQKWALCHGSWNTMRTWMSLMRLIASWLESTSQRPSDARIMISSCVVSISSRTSGVATCTPHPFLQSPSIHFTHILVGFYLVISKHFLSSLSIVSIPIHGYVGTTQHLQQVSDADFRERQILRHERQDERLKIGRRLPRK